VYKEIQQPQPVHVGRRVFLGSMGVGLVGLLIGIRQVPGLSLLSSAFSVGGFQIYTTSGIPDLTPGGYKLQVDGHVESPQSFTLADLLGMQSVRQVKDYHCVTGWTVANVAWTGVRLSDFLAMVKPTSKAKYVLLSSADGSYTESLTMEQARLPDVLLGYKLNDKPLSKEQGYPIRLVIPDMYGFKYIKWVDKITLSDHLETGYWEQRGYAVDAWLGPRSNFGYAT